MDYEPILEACLEWVELNNFNRKQRDSFKPKGQINVRYQDKIPKELKANVIEEIKYQYPIKTYYSILNPPLEILEEIQESKKSTSIPKIKVKNQNIDRIRLAFLVYTFLYLETDNEKKLFESNQDHVVQILSMFDIFDGYKPSSIKTEFLGIITGINGSGRRLDYNLTAPVWRTEFMPFFKTPLENLLDKDFIIKGDRKNKKIED